jgi:hypothetical protein
VEILCLKIKAIGEIARYPEQTRRARMSARVHQGFIKHPQPAISIPHVLSWLWLRKKRKRRHREPVTA